MIYLSTGTTTENSAVSKQFGTVAGFVHVFAVPIASMYRYIYIPTFPYKSTKCSNFFIHGSYGVGKFVGVRRAISGCNLHQLTKFPGYFFCNKKPGHPPPTA